MRSEALIRTLPSDSPMVIVFKKPCSPPRFFQGENARCAALAVFHRLKKTGFDVALYSLVDSTFEEHHGR